MLTFGTKPTTKITEIPGHGPENYDFEQIADDIVNGVNFNPRSP